MMSHSAIGIDMIRIALFLVVFCKSLVEGNEIASAVCNQNLTISIKIVLDKAAEITYLSYGDCDRQSEGVTGLSQHDDFSFAILVDIER